MRLNETDRSRIRTLKAGGVKAKDIAAEYGITDGAVYNICKGIHTKTKKEEIKKLLLDGKTAGEIQSVLGIPDKSISSVYQAAKEIGVKVPSKYNKLHEEMRAYKAGGRTNKEVAEYFGVSKSCAAKACKGIAPQHNGGNPDNLKASREKQKNTPEDVERIVKERLDNIEYAGEYTGSNGTVKLRCTICGEVFKRSWVSVRHRNVRCPKCYEKEIAENRKEKELARERREAEKKRQIERNRRGRSVVQLLKRIEKLHRCPVCGELTTNKIYCSKSCRNKAWDAEHEARRRAKLDDLIVDKGITLEAVYERDNGICKICGEPCDWDDYKIVNGQKVVGRNYPTKDHIIPLCKGGPHAWHNIQLAHLHCNSKKGARLIG